MAQEICPLCIYNNTLWERRSIQIFFSNVVHVPSTLIITSPRCGIAGPLQLSTSLYFHGLRPSAELAENDLKTEQNNHKIKYYSVHPMLNRHVYIFITRFTLRVNWKYQSQEFTKRNWENVSLACHDLLYFCSTWSHEKKSKVSLLYLSCIFIRFIRDKKFTSTSSHNHRTD